MLQKHGWKATWVQDTAMAMAELETGQYDALVVCSALASGDGATLVQEAIGWAAAAGQPLPVLGIANTSLQAEQRRLMQAGASQCLVKPVYQHDLTQVLQQLLAQPAARAQGS
jgi:DNA-binding response OmpR family regulator